jgi:rRNA processing protein Gar1
LKKRSAVAKPPKPALCVESFFDGNPIGSISHVFGPVQRHDFLFKLS